MQTLYRNQTKFYYCLYKGETEIIDSDNNYTGEYTIAYENPVLMKANISQATGNTNLEQFGNSLDYDKVIVTTNMRCPIEESTVLFIDKTPETDENGDYIFEYDYVVKKIAKSLNSISIAVKKVTVNDNV